jgi:acyl dehydratase
MGLRGIAVAIGNKFGRDVKQIDDRLESEIEIILKEGTERTKISQEDNIGYCDITEDFGVIHRDAEAARAYAGEFFRDTPIVGTLTDAIGSGVSGRVFEKLVNFWEEEGQEFKIVGQQTKFSDVVYPGDSISWTFPEQGYRENIDGVELSIVGSVKGREVASVTTRLGKDFRQMPQIAGPILSRRFMIGEKEVSKAYQCAHEEPRNEVPASLVRAYVPSTLLVFQKEKTGKEEGMNRSMDFDVIREAKQGEIQADIFYPEKIPTRPTRGNYIYRFRAVVSQDSEPLQYGVVACLTPNFIEF